MGMREDIQLTVIPRTRERLKNISIISRGAHDNRCPARTTGTFAPNDKLPGRAKRTTRICCDCVFTCGNCRVIVDQSVLRFRTEPEQSQMSHIYRSTSGRPTTLREQTAVSPRGDKRLTIQVLCPQHETVILRE